MYRRRLHRCLTALVVALAVLASPLALARYLCHGQPDALMMATMAKSGIPCAGMDQAESVLCQPSPDEAMAAFQALRLSAAPVPVLVLLHVLELPRPMEPDRAQAIPLAATPEAQPPPDPIFLSTLRLRV
jgi:hypothetical protein